MTHPSAVLGDNHIEIVPGFYTGTKDTLERQLEREVNKREHLLLYLSDWLSILMSCEQRKGDVTSAQEQFTRLELKHIALESCEVLKARVAECKANIKSLERELLHLH